MEGDGPAEEEAAATSSSSSSEEESSANTVRGEAGKGADKSGPGKYIHFISETKINPCLSMCQVLSISRIETILTLMLLKRQEKEDA
jgi:hypothetical protein